MKNVEEAIEREGVFGVTVAVSCNLSDGVILGVDSAVSVPVPNGVDKIYENADKLFQLGNLPIGVATYGLGVLGARSVGSYLREFEVRDPNGVVSGQSSMRRVVEAMRAFFMDYYRELVTPALEEQWGCTVEDIPSDKRPKLGLIVGGFSFGEYLSEVWHLLIPEHRERAEQVSVPGSFRSHWWSACEPISRYMLGYDAQLILELKDYFESLLERQLDSNEWDWIARKLESYNYRAPLGPMPMEEGVKYTRGLVELVVNPYRFTEEQPIVGGEVKVGMVTYAGEQFRLLNSREALIK